MHPVKSIIRAVIVTCVIAISGCQNPYADYYRDYSSGATDLRPYSGQTMIYSSRDFTRDGEDLVRQGYTQIGESGFEGGAVSESKLRAYAKKVGADIVLCSTAYAGSVQTVVPLLQYHPGQVSTTQYSGSVRASAYGSDGYANGTATYSGQSTTTTSGTFSTSSMPITVSRYTYFATFWRKTLSGHGAMAGVSSSHSGGEVGMPGIVWETTDQGIVVLKVLTKEAAASGILAGDVIVAIGGESAQGVNIVGGIKLLSGPIDRPLMVSVKRGDRIIELAVPCQKAEKR